MPVAREHQDHLDTPLPWTPFRLSHSAYKDAYSRINAIVIEGGTGSPRQPTSSRAPLTFQIQAEGAGEAGRMELKAHERDISACANKSSGLADMPFAARFFFTPLHGNFPDCPCERQGVHLLLDPSAVLIRSLRDRRLNHILHSVADPFGPRKITEGVVEGLSNTPPEYGQEWLKANLEASRASWEVANAPNLPLVSPRCWISGRRSA